MNLFREKLVIIVILFCLIYSVLPGLEGINQVWCKENPKELNIALIFITQLEDQWNITLIQSLERLQIKKPHGLAINFDYTEAVALPDAERVLNVYAATGKYEIIIAHSIYPDAVNKLRKRYPEILWVVSGWDNGLMGKNGYVMAYDLHDSAYLLGMIAGMMTKTNIVGAVCSFPCPEQNAPVNAFAEGARDVNPKIKFVVSYIESWFDPAKAKEFTLAQIAAGVDMVYATTYGILKACVEKDVYAFGHESDHNYLAPENVISSSMALWDPQLSYFIDEWWNHVTKGVPYNAPMEVIAFGMKDGGTAMAPYYKLKDKIPVDVQTMVEKKKKEIIDEDFKVPFLPQKAVSTK